VWTSITTFWTQIGTERTIPSAPSLHRLLFLAAVIEGRIDPVEQLELFNLAMEPQFRRGRRRPGPRLACAERRDAGIPPRRDLRGLDESRRLTLRISPAVMRARALHRVPDGSRRALMTAYSALFQVEQAAARGGGLLQALGSSSPNVFAEQVLQRRASSPRRFVECSSRRQHAGASLERVGASSVHTRSEVMRRCCMPAPTRSPRRRSICDGGRRTGRSSRG